MASMDVPEYVKVSEVAEKLRVSKMTVYRMFDDGEFEGAVRIGRSIRIPAAAVTDYLARQAR